MPFINRKGRRTWVDPAEFDESPLFAVEVNADGELDHTMAYDPRIERRCEDCGGLSPLDGPDDCACV